MVRNSYLIIFLLLSFHVSLFGLLKKYGILDAYLLSPSNSTNNNFPNSLPTTSTNFGVQCKPLMTTRCGNLARFRELVQIKYDKDYARMDSAKCLPSVVELSYTSNGETITHKLESGIGQGDLIKAQKKDKLNKCLFVLNNLNPSRERKNLENVFLLSRRRPDLFGSKDEAFYYLAEASFRKINSDKLAFRTPQDSSEKGYINTFNHITAQAIITSFFSEDLADLIADLHERYNMPELTTGRFTDKQLNDSINSPVDNYVDILNNEIGQKLGQALKVKYGLDKSLHCNPEFLANYLNDIQSYYMWSLEIGLDPFHSNEAVVIQFSKKLNAILKNIK